MTSGQKFPKLFLAQKLLLASHAMEHTALWHEGKEKEWRAKERQEIEGGD